MNEYNQFRQYSSLNYQPPVPETIIPKVEILTLSVVQQTGAGRQSFENIDQQIQNKNFL
jgi:hypothetical protein